MQAILKAIGVVLYIGLGFIQLAATFAGVNVYLGLHGFAAFLIGGFAGMMVAWLPIIGTAAGMYGAVVAWHWSIWSAALLFGLPYAFFAVALVVIGIAALFEMMQRRGQS